MKAKWIEDLNYLNMQEIKKLCSQLNIPYKIHYEYETQVRSSGEVDRKDIILARIRQFIENGSCTGKTIYPANVVSFAPLNSPLKANDLVYYGQYKTTQKPILKLMKSLTNNQFKFGAISQIVIRDFWRTGKAPSYLQFAHAWTKALRDHDKPRPEWAFLTDLAAGMNMKEWKKYRVEKAKAVLVKLRSLSLAEKN